MNQKFKSSQSIASPRLPFWNKAWFKVITVSTLALSTAVAMFSCATPNANTASQIPPSAFKGEVFKLPNDVNADVSAESATVYHYLMGQVAGVHSALAEQQGDEAKGLALINVAIPNLVQANEYLNDAELAEQTAKTALFAKRYDDAQKSAQRWMALQPLRSKPYQLASIVEMEQGHYDKAASYLNQVIGLENETEQGESTVLALLDTIKNAEQVVGVADALALQFPSSIMPALASARAWHKQKQYARALPYLENVLNKDARRVEAILLKADVLERTESAEVAAQFLEGQVESQPKNEFLRSAYAELLSQSGQHSKASEQYKQLLNDGKADMAKDVPVLMRLAQAQLQQERGDQAVVYLKRILAIKSEEERYVRALPSVYYRLGMAYEMQENWPKAMDAYQSLQSLEKSDAWLQDTALVRMVIVDLQQKKYVQAKNTLDKLGGAVRSWQAKSQQDSQPVPYEDGEDPVEQLSIEWHQLRTEWHTRQDDHDNAYVTINQALDAHPESFDLRYTRSLVAEQLGNTDIAISDLEKLLVQKPDSPDVKNALGYTLANKTDQYDRAYTLIKEALDELPDSYAVMDSMGWVLFKQGKFEDAERYLRKAYEQSKDAEISAHLVDVLWAQSKQSEATQILNQALAENPTNEVLNKTKARLMN